jgi:anti-sigma28 factor (negative regulator of flagellin synthesis)
MKIYGSDPNNTPKLNPATSAGPVGTGATGQRSVGSDVPTDRAQLSNLSSYLASALDGSPAHAAKLSELGAAVSSGQYHVDIHAVSGSLIQHSIEFGGSSYLGLTT